MKLQECTLKTEYKHNDKEIANDIKLLKDNKKCQTVISTVVNNYEQLKMLQ